MSTPTPTNGTGTDNLFQFIGSSPYLVQILIVGGIIVILLIIALMLKNKKRKS
jgi:hypothetical protein